MPVYPPNAVVGNSRVLVSIGAKAELMTFFYPHIDFAQNLHEGMPAVYFPGAGSQAGRLVWTFDSSWQSTQRYLDRTNLLETELRHRDSDSDLGLRIVDFVHPSEHTLVRRFEATNLGTRPLRAKLFQYLDFQLGEVEHKNAVHFQPDRKLAAVYWRNICFGVGADDFDEYGCGRANPGSSNSAKLQIERGQLNRQEEEIGDIDLALGWNLDLAPGERLSRFLIIAADSSELAAGERVDAARALGSEALLKWSRSRWEQYVARAQPLHIEHDLREAYYRCLLAIDLLADPDTGSILAAPEFDPLFERSGGYGYCWPRDAVEVCLALEAAGYPEYMTRFLTWARASQRPEGYWEQRYWLTGQRGPAWCTREHFLQIDQTASVLFAMGRHARRLDSQDQITFLEASWDSAKRAADYLTRDLDPEYNLHTTAFDLWETFRGTFTYSNAAISAALREAAFLARLANQEAFGEQWEATACAIRRAIMSTLWQGDIFARGLDLNGNLDTAADASLLGLITPFQFLRLDDPEDCAIARTTVDSLAQRVVHKVGGAETLHRYEGDQYAGGEPGAVTTLWFARVLLRLALACTSDPSAAAAYRARAVASMRAVLASGTSTGLLPEMMAGVHGPWAVPHAWTMASFVMAALLLDQLPTSADHQT